MLKARRSFLFTGVTALGWGLSSYIIAWDGNALDQVHSVDNTLATTNKQNLESINKLHNSPHYFDQRASQQADLIEKVYVDLGEQSASAQIEAFANPQAYGSSVFLFGKVDSTESSLKAELSAHRFPGVYKVHNYLQVIAS